MTSGHLINITRPPYQVSNLQKNKDGSWRRIDQENSREDGNQDGNYQDEKVDDRLDFAELSLHLGGRYETHQDRADDGDTAAWQEDEQEDLQHLLDANDVV